MDSWNELGEWWLEESRDPSYREEVIPLFLEVLPEVEGQILLDLGIGDGRVADLVVGRGATVIGVDINRTLARMAARRHPVLLNRLPWMACVRSAAADGAYAVLALEHFEDSGIFFQETARVIRPGCSLTVVINHPLFTAPGSGPILDPSDGELLWRVGY